MDLCKNNLYTVFFYYYFSSGSLFKNFIASSSRSPGTFVEPFSFDIL